MVNVLRINKTGELYRLLDQSQRGIDHAINGVVVRCFNALVWKGRGRARKREYDRVLDILYNETLHTIFVTGNDPVEAHELRRARELLCWKYHPQKCSPRPDTFAPVVPVSVSQDDGYWRNELIRVARTCQEYIDNQGRFSMTRLAVLKYELNNVLGYFKNKMGKGVSGERQAEKGEAAQGNAASSEGLSRPYREA